MTCTVASDGGADDSEAPVPAIPADIDVFELAVLGMGLADLTGRFCRINPSFARLLGHSAADLIGASLSGLVSNDDGLMNDSTMTELLTEVVGTGWFRRRYTRPDGSAVWIEMNVCSLTAPDGAVLGFLAHAVDITDRTRAEEAVESERRRLAEAQHLAGMSNFELDPVTGIIHASAEARENLGLPVGFDLATFTSRVHSEDQEMFAAAVRRCLEDRTPIDHVQRHLRADGTVRWVRFRAAWTVGEDGQGKVAGTTLDITDRRRAEDALEFRTFHDPVTGLANRALFLERADLALRRAQHRADPVAVLYLDIDDFKMVNDSLGHLTGDHLLAAIAGRLESVTREGDTLARLGGDEFALLIESGRMPQAAEDAARRITSALRRPFLLRGAEVTVGASIGIAVGQQAQDSCEDLLRDADLAMYLAKQNGKGRFEVVRPGMRDQALKRLALITDLRHALERREFEVFYQPIMGVRGIRPAGVEALLRWHHPLRGLVLPGEFIDVAESTGLIAQLGNSVLIEACRQAQTWRQAGTVDDAFYVSVNLSPRQLAEPSLIDNVARALRVCGLAPRALVLEITESTLMLDFEVGLDRLRSLKSLGVRLALDDYGTGYSSLNRLGKLPVDIVKIDKSFVDQLSRGPEGAALIRSVVDVTHALGMISVAEGVEIPEQYGILEQLGCDAIQGYLFAMPQPAGDTERTLKRLAVRPSQRDDRHRAWARPFGRVE